MAVSRGTVYWEGNREELLQRWGLLAAERNTAHSVTNRAKAVLLYLEMLPTRYQVQKGSRVSCCRISPIKVSTETPLKLQKPEQAWRDGMGVKNMGCPALAGELAQSLACQWSSRQPPNSSPRGSCTLFWPPWAHILMCTDTRT